MRYLSLFSGIEAASAAWHPMGWQCAAVSEIEPFPCAVLAHHYPTVPNLGDITKFKEWPDLGTVDLVVGGSPCQSFSVAGLRKGMDDPRGNLMLTYLAVINRVAPRWVVYENVPGLLSSNGGRDFGTLLGGLAELGYGFAYRVLDAQYFGVAQRRRRVFVVGYFGDWRPAAAVLFERESLLGHPAQRREARQAIAPAISARTKGGGGLGTDFDCDGGLVARTLRAQPNPSHRADSDNYIVASTGQVSHCLNAGGMGRIDYETDTLIAHALRGEGFDASEDGTGRGTPLVPVSYAIQAGATRENPESGPDGIGVQADIAYTLEARAEVQAIAFDCKASGQNGFGVGEIASTMRSMGHSNSHQNGGGHLAVAFQCQGSNVGEMGTLRKGNGGVTGGIPFVAQAVNIRGRDGGATAELSGDVATALRASQGGGDKLHALTGSAVRRLTPRECERLQGFPDDYTLINVRGKPAADGPRYKALGNSMAVPVMRWIGDRIQMIENLTAKDAA